MPTEPPVWRQPWVGWLLAFAASGLQGPEPFLRWPGAADGRRADGVISGRFELHPAWNMEPSTPRLRQLSWNAVRMWQRWCRRTQNEPVMGVDELAGAATPGGGGCLPGGGPGDAVCQLGGGDPGGVFLADQARRL
jgi:hypothetical protein